jgi:Mg/Co/Ni transporter MgtE
MEGETASQILRETSAGRAAALVAAMEPDEAADALRDLDEDEQREILDALEPPGARELRELLAFHEDEAGGLMTTTMVVVPLTTPIDEVKRQLGAPSLRGVDVDRVIVVDGDGRLVDEVTLHELILAGDGPIDALLAPPWPITVSPHDPIDDVVEGFRANRGSSIVVVDDAGRPVGRILADDLVDAFVERSSRLARWLAGSR